MRIGNLLNSVRIIKGARHKRFQYSPIYYDEQKEKIEERKKIIQKSVEEEAKLSEEQRKAIRELNTYEWRRPVYRRASLMSSLRFFIILMALVILFAWFFIKYSM